MKTLLTRPLVTLILAAGAVLLAGCTEQSRHATQPVPVTTAAAPPASEPAIIARPDPAGANVSPPIAEVARLHLSGLDETIVKAFVEKSTNAANPTADELIYLKDIGVSPRVITALIQQTAKMREQATAAAATALPNNPPPAPASPTVTVIAANTPPPAASPAAPVAPAPQPTAPVPAPAPAPVAVPAPVAAAPANLPAQVNIFYQQLQPYGTWMQVADHGWCWQPSVVLSSPGWRPYADRGRWLYTNHGWYWQSDYAWGWAPFHYGRWVQHARSGWLWVPDNVWGPAWVVWRSSASHCGWAPLPPGAAFVAGSGLHFGGTRVSVTFDFGLPRHHFTFVPFNRFCDRNPHYYALAPTVVQNVYNQTTVINNIQVTNNVVVNNGVPATQIAALTRSEIRKVAVLEAAPQDSAPARLDRLERAGNDLVIYRPTLNPHVPLKPVTLTNSKGETRTELVTAGTTEGQKILGRPTYDTTSTGVPVLTGYTTAPASPAPARSTVVINNNVITPPPTAAPAPTPTVRAEQPQTAAPVKIFGISPGGSTVAKRMEERPPTPATVTVPNTSQNSLFRPITPPSPVTSTPQILPTPRPVTSTPATPTAPQPISPYQPATRAEAPKPAANPAPTSAPVAAPKTSQPMSIPATSPAPVRVTPVVPPAPVTVAPTYTPPPRPAAPVPTPTPQPVAPAPARPTVVIPVPTPPPSPAPATPPANNSTPSRAEQEKRNSR